MFKKIIAAIGIVFLFNVAACKKIKQINYVDSNSYAIGDANALLGTALDSHNSASNADLLTSNMQGVVLGQNAQAATQLNNLKLG